MKNKKPTHLLIVLLLIFCQSIHAQSKTTGIEKYVIFIFEVTHKDSKLKENYYWITSQDSIEKRTAFEVFPLYTEEYSKDVLDRCKEGQRIDIFTSSTATNFNFDNDYKLGIKNLVSLVNNNKIKIQSFKKRWEQNGNEENINVYASPILGEFCSCLQMHGSAMDGFKGISYLPVTSFTYDKSFWAGKIEKVVRFVDYSYVEYSSHYPSNMHGNSNIRVKSRVQIW